jgi:hypothetical protein
MSSSLVVNGTTYNTSSRKTNSLIITARGWDLDSDLWLEFQEYCAGPQPKFAGPYAVTSTDPSGTLRFAGNITGVQPGWSAYGRTWNYRCLGLKNRANWLPVVAVDGSGVMTYDLPYEDEDAIASNNGKSVGAIVAAVLTQHATALTAAGITTDATTTSQLAALTLVPNERVVVAGERLWQALESVFLRWARNQRLVILASGLVRVVDVSAGSAHTLTLGTDPVDPPLFSREWTHCASRVAARGAGRIRPAYVSTLASQLTASWSGADQSAWTWADFAKPADAYDKGTVNSVLGPTSVRVTSSSGTVHWPINFWSDRQAWIYLTKTTGTGLTYQESAPITACTAMVAGGTSDLTLGLTLDNQGASDYDAYTLIGKVAPAGSGRNNVWRLYNVVTPGNLVERHLVKRFPAPVPFVGLNGSMAMLTTSPVASIYKSLSSYPATFRVMPDTGQVLFDRPVIELLNSQAALNIGGGSVTIYDDIWMLLAYSRGALTAPYPADVAGVPQYAGTSYSAAGLSRTLYADVDTWRYEGNQSTMVSFAQMVHGSVSDTVVEGTVKYKGYYTTVEDPTGGHKLNIAAAYYTTGDESLAIPVRAVTYRYESAGGGLLYETEMRCTSRRDPRTDQGFYLHLSQLGTGGQFGAMAGGLNPFGVWQPPTDPEMRDPLYGARQLGAMAAAGPATAGMVDPLGPALGTGDPGGAGGSVDRAGAPGGQKQTYPGRRKRRGLAKRRPEDRFMPTPAADDDEHERQLEAARAEYEGRGDERHRELNHARTEARARAAARAEDGRVVRRRYLENSLNAAHGPSSPGPPDGGAGRGEAPPAPTPAPPEDGS